MRINVHDPRQKPRTHEGAPAKRITPIQALRRSVLSCLLWENEFYEDGTAIADRILENADACAPEAVAELAVEARKTHGLRHVPLLLLLNLIKRNAPGLADTIDRTIGRPDEIGELVALFWMDGRKMLPRQMRAGLAKAFNRFSEHSLAKYDRDSAAVKLRDVLRLVHPKPKDEERSALLKRVATRTLETPDTWEVALSGGADKKETFERLLREEKLGYLAVLRNLRNMVQAGVDVDLIETAILARKGAELVFPFRYTAAARAAPQLEPALDKALIEAIETGPLLLGTTIVLVDVSHSMNARLSAKSDMTRMDAAATLASVINGHVRMFSFSHRLVEVPPRRGMAGVDAIIRSQAHGATELGMAVYEINRAVKHDRLIVITDEQANSPVPDPVAKNAYMINVASNRNGVGYGRWTHIDGFSEAVIRFILESENQVDA